MNILNIKYKIYNFGIKNELQKLHKEKKFNTLIKKESFEKSLNETIIKDDHSLILVAFNMQNEIESLEEFYTECYKLTIAELNKLRLKILNLIQLGHDPLNFTIAMLKGVKLAEKINKKTFTMT